MTNCTTTPRRRRHLSRRSRLCLAGFRRGLKAESGPQQLGPDIVGGHPWSRTDQGVDTARQGENTRGVEPAGQQPLPFLDVPEEDHYSAYEGGLLLGLEGLAEVPVEAAGAHDVVADLHAVDGRDPGRARPPAGLEQCAPAVEAGPVRHGRRGCPPFHPLGVHQRPTQSSAHHGRAARGTPPRSRGTEGAFLLDYLARCPDRRPGADPGQQRGVRRSRPGRPQLVGRPGTPPRSLKPTAQRTPTGTSAGALCAR